MILKGDEARRYLSAPNPARAGLLIAGADAMRVALRRQEAIAALIGPSGEEEMRLTRLPAAQLRKDPAALQDALKAVGFFPGLRVVYLEEASDGLSASISEALEKWQEGDAVLVVSAGALGGKSTLKSLFDKAKNAVSITLYDDPPSRAEIADQLKAAGLSAPPSEAMADLNTLAHTLEPGDFRQLLEKVSLYKRGDDSPLSSDEIAALAPATIEGDSDALLHAVAEGEAPRVGVLLRRLEGQGSAPVTLCIQAMRHFRALHSVAVAGGGGAQSAWQRARVFGPRRSRMQRQVERWSTPALEEAIALLLETDLTLRSASRAPVMAVMERALIRLAMMKR